MAANITWRIAVPAIDHNAYGELEDAAPSHIGLENSTLWGSGSTRIIGASAGLQRVLQLARVVAPTDATELIQGAPGTGKEVLAETIHPCRDLSNGPVVK